MPDPKECFKPHPMIHNFLGLGIGLILAGLIPALASGGVVIGIIVAVLAIASEFVFLPKKGQPTSQ